VGRDSLEWGEKGRGTKLFLPFLPFLPAAEKRDMWRDMWRSAKP
jgi:hypothetical protein